MSKSRETYAVPQDDYRAQANERFLPAESEMIRAEYIARGLTDTNNLKLYLRDVETGIYDMNDYRDRVFAPVIDEFRVMHEEQWNVIQDLRAAAAESERAYWQMQNDQDPQAEKYADLADELKWEYMKAVSEAYDMIAPMVKRAGLRHDNNKLVEPVEVCV